MTRTHPAWPLLLVSVTAFTLWAALHAQAVMRALDEYERGRG